MVKSVLKVKNAKKADKVVEENSSDDNELDSDVDEVDANDSDAASDNGVQDDKDDEELDDEEGDSNEDDDEEGEEEESDGDDDEDEDEEDDEDDSDADIEPVNSNKKKQNLNSVFVGHLDFKTTEEELKEHFSKAGKVLNARVIPRKGFGFVDFEDASALPEALKFDKTSFKDREILVEISKSSADDNKAGKRKMAPEPVESGKKSKPSKVAEIPKQKISLKTNTMKNKK